MANGRLTLGKQSGGTLGLVFPDGVSDTEVVLPESGNIVSVDTAVTDNAIARYDGMTGKLQNSGVIVDDIGNVGIGVIPNSITSGYTALQIHKKAGLFLMSSTNDTHLSTNVYHNSGYKYQTSGISATDYAQGSGAHYWRTSSSGTAGGMINWTNTMTLDASGNLLLTSGTGALGYGIGAGGTVTQLTSKNTAVTLNKPCGTITMNNSEIPAGSYVVFNFTCSLLTTFDSIKFQIIGGYSSYESYTLDSSMTNGSMVRVVVKNTTAASLSEALILSYIIIKGSNS